MSLCICGITRTSGSRAAARACRCRRCAALMPQWLSGRESGWRKSGVSGRICAMIRQTCSISAASLRSPTTILTEIFQDVYACDGCALAAIPSGLPVMGLNGTLYDRLGDEHMGGRVRAKTGTLIKSNSLSGYLMTDQGRLLTFSILVDGIEPGTSPVARDAQDDFLIALAGL